MRGKKRFRIHYDSRKYDKQKMYFVAFAETGSFSKSQAAYMSFVYFPLLVNKD